MIAKNEKQIQKLRTAGRLMAEVVKEVLAKVRPGVSALELDAAARAAIAKRGGISPFEGYKMKGDRIPFPGAMCVSINDEVVHGIPTERVLQSGDIVSLDFGLNFEGAFMDTAHTLLIGKADKKAELLLRATEEALAAGIDAARVGNTTGHIGAAVEAIAKKYKFGVVEELSGHGVGAAVHELPYVPNYGKPGEGEELVEGLVIAIEPMFTEGSGDLVLGEDKWTYTTKDHSRAAHSEHTVLLTKKGPEILTAL